MDALASEEATAALRSNGAPAPEGFATDDEFLADAREKFQLAADAEQENRDAAMDDLMFLTGEGQWDKKVKADRLKKGRPCLTINTLPQYVGQVIGDMRTNRPSIKVRPAEDGDKKVAEIRQGLIRFIENQSNATHAYALAGEDQVSCGIGHFRAVLEYASGETFDQNLRIKHIPNPFAVVWDPLSVEPTGADARFCFVVDEWDRKTFEAMYPNTPASELTVQLTSQGWVSSDSVRVTEYWVMKETRRTIALVQRDPEAAPEIVDVTDLDAEKVAPLVVRDRDGRPRMRSVIKRSACMYLITGQAILEGPFEYPISRLPIFRVTGREVRVGDKRYRFGLLRFAKDSLRMKNLWRSSAAEWLAKAPKQQWLVHSSGEEDAKRLRTASKSDDPVIVYSGNQPPARMDPPSAPSALLQEAQFNDQDIKDTTGLHDASLGMRSNETSGKAIIARERQGDVATFMYHDNLNLAVKECGRVCNEFLPVLFDRARTVVILGEDEVAKSQRINDPNDPKSINLGDGEYDVMVETGPSYSTKRAEAAEQLTQLAAQVPAIGQVGPDIIVRSLDVPHGDELADRIKRSLPPGLLADEGDQEDPRRQQQQAMQMQAQQEARQLAERRAQMELAEQAAKTRQAEANADKAEAEARRAQIEADQAAMAVGSSYQPLPEGLPA